MSKLHIIPALKDNYIWLLEIENGMVIIIDPGDAEPVVSYLRQHQLHPIAILLTHRHDDHIAGVPTLQHRYPALPVYGPSEVPLPIHNITDRSEITVGDTTLQIIAVPGHTLGHVAYYTAPYLFCGDTLFSAGCGRIFEGSFAQMYHSLQTLKMLPDQTIVCPAHEYTLSNLKFAHHLVPEELTIAIQLKRDEKRAITLPTTLEIEKKINLFLRCGDKNLQQKFNVNSELDLFTYFRTQKDNF